MDPQNPAEPTATEPQEPTGAPPAPADPAATDPAPADPKSNPWDDPAAAQAEIEKLRRENAKDRTTAKAQAAEDAKNELAQTIGKALGLVEDGQIDPARLTESLTAAQEQAKQAQVALAVYQNAGTAGGDPVALLDSTTFLKSVAGIDPADAAAVAAAFQAAVTANPRLGAAPADPRAPLPNPAQGGSGAGAPDLETQIAAAQKAGDIKTAIHLQNQKLAPQTRV
jgi:hypothetical protein